MVDGNDLAERIVKEAILALHRETNRGDSSVTVVIRYCTTLCSVTCVTPAELIAGRRLVLLIQTGITYLDLNSAVLST